MRHPAFSVEILAAAGHSAAAAARRGMARTELYDRLRHLPRVMPVGPAELTDNSLVMRRKILARLARALRAERIRGRAGHWAYDLNRHIGLAQAYAAERRQLGRDAAVQS